ncbi:MAG: transposase [Bradymonadia bacterium]
MLCFLIPTAEVGKKLISYLGLAPVERQSSTSVRGRARLPGGGNATIRSKLYIPTLTAMRCNPTIKAFAERLKEKGKPMLVIITTCMKKLACLCFGVWHSKEKYRPDYVASSAA